MKILKTTVLEETDIRKIRAVINPSLKNRYVRGQSRSSYKLTASFFRKHKRIYHQKDTAWIFCRNYFSPYEWKEEVKGEWHKDDDDNPLRTTFPMGIGECGENSEMFPQLIGMAIQQHHGVLPTPLLDVSYDVEMPLYCACRNHLESDGKLFVVSVNHDDYWGNNDFETEPLYFQNMLSPHNRLRRQKGMFLRTTAWMRDDEIAYNDPGLAFGDISLSFNAEVEEFIIPKENKAAILYNLAALLKPELSLYDYFGKL